MAAARGFDTTLVYQALSVIASFTIMGGNFNL